MTALPIWNVVRLPCAPKSYGVASVSCADDLQLVQADAELVRADLGHAGLHGTRADLRRPRREHDRAVLVDAAR